MASNLTPERWRRLDELFNAAVELSPAARDAFVARETADDPELASALAGMLAHGALAGARIARAIQTVADTVDGPSPWIGRRFGAYRLVREIGRGGMGLVFEAVRDDEEYSKRVALKIAPSWRDVPLLKDRFRQERQIVAGLEHPHIARFLDGGTADGIPYFAMEYVEGTPITAYCDAGRVPLRVRLELFRKICGAVRFAHENLVVHRDLKPANILVTAGGEPKLLDFGIAKLLENGVDSRATLTGDMIWTPDYTSPEQVRGRPVTVRTDVYSLGLILYELLTGERAQVSDTSSPAALDRSICEIEPAPPSRRALERGDRAAARALTGDLDTIVLTAMAKDPERRYESVGALSDDILRYLERRPILARPSTIRYRLARFVRRNRVAVAGAALVAISIAAGVTAALAQARRAEHRFQQVRTLAHAFVFNVHDRIETLPGSTEARKAIVETALTYLESLRSEVADDPALALEVAATYEKVGNVQGNPVRANLGDTTGAIQSFMHAQQVLQPFADAGDRRARRELASVLMQLATVRRAKGDRAAAMSAFTRARDLAEDLLTGEPSDPELLQLAGEIHASIARAEFELRRFTAAEAAGHRAMQVAERLVQLDPSNRQHRDGLSLAHNALGAGRIAAGRIAQAAESFRASVAIREVLVAEEPNNTEYRRNLLVSYGNLGDVLGVRLGENLGDFAGAARAFARAIELSEWARQRDPSDRRALFDLANARLRLGTILTEQRQPERSIAELNAARRLTDTLLAQDPKNDRYGIVGLVIDRRMADALVLTNRRSDAVRQLERVRAAAMSLLDGPNGPNARQQLLLASANLAALYAETGDRRSGEMARWVSAELQRKPLGNPAFEKAVGTALGRIGSIPPG